MKIQNESNNKISQWLVRSLLFVIAVVLLAYFFPRQGEKQYIFQEGRPWAYSLLTAPFDIPIYKDEARLQAERDSIMRDLRPIFVANKALAGEMVQGFDNEIKQNTSAV